MENDSDYKNIFLQKITPFLKKSDEIQDFTSTSGINLLFQKYQVINTLSKSEGIERYSKKLEYDDARWFELQVAYVFLKIGEKPKFISVNNNPKDVVLEHSSSDIIIECKKFINSSSLALISELRKGFKKDSINLNNIFGRNDGKLKLATTVQSNWPGFESPTTIEHTNDHRLFGNGIEEKDRQLIEGFCNLIALDVTVFANKLSFVAEVILKHQIMSNFKKLSGILLFASEQDYYNMGYNFYCYLLPNNDASIAIPSNFQMKSLQNYEFQIQL